MKILTVFVRSNRIVGCDVSMMGGIVFVPCVQCIQVKCPHAQALVKDVATSRVPEPNVQRKEGS